jgi:cytochrome P450
LLSQQSGGRPDDILTLLLDARDPETGDGLSEEELRANIVTLIAAGHETTANALTWSLFLLSRDTDWQERVAAEARRTFAGEWNPDRLALTRGDRRGASALPADRGHQSGRDRAG